MDLKEILAISGYPGLYRHVSQGRNGIIVESLTDGKRMPAYTTMKVSSLEDIAVFTNDSEIPLKDVFRRLFEKETGGPSISNKSTPDEIRNYFEEVFPEYDRDKVYISDMKKIISWYNLLQELKMLEFEEENSGQKTEDSSQETEVRRQETEVRRQEAEDRRQKTEVRSQKSGVRRQKTEVRRQKSGDRS